MDNKIPDNDAETRQERRQKRLSKKRERLPQHGKNLARTYMNAILKRLKGRRKGVDKQ